MRHSNTDAAFKYKRVDSSVYNQLTVFVGGDRSFFTAHFCLSPIHCLLIKEYVQDLPYSKVSFKFISND